MSSEEQSNHFELERVDVSKLGEWGVSQLDIATQVYAAIEKDIPEVRKTDPGLAQRLENYKTEPVAFGRNLCGFCAVSAVINIDQKAPVVAPKDIAGVIDQDLRYHRSEITPDESGRYDNGEWRAFVLGQFTPYHQALLPLAEKFDYQAKSVRFDSLQQLQEGTDAASPVGLCLSVKNVPYLKKYRAGYVKEINGELNVPMRTKDGVIMQPIIESTHIISVMKKNGSYYVIDSFPMPNEDGTDAPLAFPIESLAQLDDVHNKQALLVSKGEIKYQPISNVIPMRLPEALEDEIENSK